MLNFRTVPWVVIACLATGGCSRSSTPRFSNEQLRAVLSRETGNRTLLMGSPKETRNLAAPGCAEVFQTRTVFVRLAEPEDDIARELAAVLRTEPENWTLADLQVFEAEGYVTIIMSPSIVAFPRETARVSIARNSTDPKTQRTVSQEASFTCHETPGGDVALSNVSLAWDLDTGVRTRDEAEIIIDRGGSKLLAVDPDSNTPMAFVLLAADPLLKT